VAGASAADDTEEQPPQQPSPVFFGEGRDYIDYWNSRWAEKAKSEKKSQNGSDHTPAQSRWSEPAAGEDGQVKTYYPPKQVSELLENPTEENARAYLQWQRERMRRIQEAHRVLEKVKLSLEIDELAKRIKSAGVSVRLDLYVQEGCPHCETQKSILAELVKRMPDLAVRTVELIKNPALVRELSIESVPTMIITTGGSSVRKVGVVSQSQLVRLVELLISEPKDEK
jgi:glutaredoxin